MLGEIEALKRKVTERQVPSTTPRPSTSDGSPEDRAPTPEQHVSQRTRSETGPTPRPPLEARAEDPSGNDFDSTRSVQPEAEFYNGFTVESIGWKKIDECFQL